MRESETTPGRALCEIEVSRAGTVMPRPDADLL